MSATTNRFALIFLFSLFSLALIFRKNFPHKRIKPSKNLIQPVAHRFSLAKVILVRVFFTFPGSIVYNNFSFVLFVDIFAYTRLPKTRKSIKFCFGIPRVLWQEIIPEKGFCHFKFIDWKHFECVL